jgi:hypothetical protein
MFVYSSNPFSTLPFYALPDIYPKRSTAFGYGTRYNFAGHAGSPGPGHYILKSEFLGGKDTGSPNTSKGFTFGMSRDSVGVMFETAGPKLKNSIPGPGAYHTEHNLGSDAQKFSFRPRTNNSGKGKNLTLPGPGAYGLPSGIDVKGKYFFAKFRNSGAVLFSPPSSLRFRDHCKEDSMLIFH